MANPQPELASLSDAVTHNIRVEVMSQYSPANSQPLKGEWVFQYTVRITNLATETVQLLSRHWIIIDGTGQRRDVEGPGVVGQQPILARGQSFQYSSWCPLGTPVGEMRGTYQMVRKNGERFYAEIAPFSLKARYTVH